jgi:hypothetical protein
MESRRATAGRSYGVMGSVASDMGSSRTRRSTEGQHRLTAEWWGATIGSMPVRARAGRA